MPATAARTLAVAFRDVLPGGSVRVGLTITVGGKKTRYTVRCDRPGRAAFTRQGAAPETHDATAAGCTCNDWRFRGAASSSPCKHMAAFRALAARGVLPAD